MHEQLVQNCGICFPFLHVVSICEVLNLVVFLYILFGIICTVLWKCFSDCIRIKFTLAMLLHLFQCYLV